MTWIGGVEAIQYLERCTNLPSGLWVPVATNRPPTAETNALALPPFLPDAFYRIRVER